MRCDAMRELILQDYPLSFRREGVRDIPLRSNRIPLLMLRNGEREEREKEKIKGKFKLIRIRDDDDQK